MIDELKKISDDFSPSFIMGDKIMISDNNYIIPVFKTKVNYLCFETSIKENGGDFKSSGVNYDPICFIEVKNNQTTILPINERRENIISKVPTIIENLDIANILKGIKI